ncbi:MiaB/RimO family radical SAM methylthiotransferase [Oecophyllibacter saccharovorans]|nr:MiaB/RimO family radical SAM methylthiotransferase [Oecophyllibacter saccharovorans]
MSDKDETVSLLTFGCRLNAHESDAMGHYARLARREGADAPPTIIVNTCTVTAEAERQARQAIRRAHRQNPQARIIVTGCASERAPDSWRALPGVSQVVANGTKLNPASWGVEAEADPGLPPSRHTRALLQVQQGCDHRCTFCIIPFGRGAARSLPQDEIIARARALAEAGHVELVLTGVDIASWQESGRSLGALCQTLLDSVPDIARLRLSSIDPTLLDTRTGDRALWQLLAEEPRFMPHLHLSLQAGADLILKRMKRRHLTENVRKLVQQVRRLRPDTGFGADLIAGFPTETDALFEEGCRFIEELGLPFLHVFPYSERPGTPAARMPALPRALRQERAARLRQLGYTNRDAFLARFVGRETEVLMETPIRGHTPEFAAFKLDALSPARPGIPAGLQPEKLHRFRVTRVADGKLHGVPLSLRRGDPHP